MGRAAGTDGVEAVQVELAVDVGRMVEVDAVGRVALHDDIGEPRGGHDLPRFRWGALADEIDIRLAMD